MTREQHERRSMPPIRQRHDRRRRGGRGGRDAWNDFDLDARRAERLDLLRGAAEDERVAPLQPDDGQSLPGVVNHQVIDGLLAERLRSVPLADALRARGLRHEREDLHGDEVVVQDDVGAAEDTERFERQEIGVAGGRRQRAPPILQPRISRIPRIRFSTNHGFRGLVVLLF
jgi:hypothetical protein